MSASSELIDGADFEPVLCFCSVRVRIVDLADSTESDESFLEVDFSDHAQDAQVSTVAGGFAGFADGQRLDARMRGPRGLAVANGTVLVADRGNNALRRLLEDGTLVTLAGSSAGASGSADGAAASARFWLPSGLAVRASDNAVFVADTENGLIRLVLNDGTVSTVCGVAGGYGHRDGSCAAALFRRPMALAASPTASGFPLYVADTENNAVRLIESNGTVSTFAGTTEFGHLDAHRVLARFKHPAGLALTAGGDLFVADPHNNCVRRVAAGSGVVTTFSGSPAQEAGSTAGSALNARFWLPSSITLDATSGGFVVSDALNHRLALLSAAGAASVIAGGGQAGALDGPASAGALLGYPRESGFVAAQGKRWIYFVDESGNTLRRAEVRAHWPAFVHV